MRHSKGVCSMARLPRTSSSEWHNDQIVFCASIRGSGILMQCIRSGFAYTQLNLGRHSHHYSRVLQRWQEASPHFVRLCLKLAILPLKVVHQDLGGPICTCLIACSFIKSLLQAGKLLSVLLSDFANLRLMVALQLLYYCLLIELRCLQLLRQLLHFPC